MIKLQKILIKDMLVKKPYTITVDSQFSKVWDMFVSYKIRHLPVLNDKNILVGIITQRDLYKIISPRKTMEGNFVYDKNMLNKYILKNVMKKSVLTLSPTDTLGSAIEIMVRKKYGCIPIVNDDKTLAGIITQIDVLRIINKYFI